MRALALILVVALGGGCRHFAITEAGYEAASKIADACARKIGG